MKVHELRKILNTVMDDAEVLVWDADRSAWARPRYETTSVSGEEPWSSLVLGTAAHFADCADTTLPLLETPVRL